MNNNALYPRVYYTLHIYTHSAISYLNPIHQDSQRKRTKNVNSDKDQEA